MRARPSACLGLAAALTGAAALAQVAPPAPGGSTVSGSGSPQALDPVSMPLLTDLSVEAAIDRARRQQKLLLVFWSHDEPGQGHRWTFEACQKSVTLRAYVKWHAIAVASRTLPPRLAAEVCAEMQTRGLRCPAVIVVRDGHLEQIIADTKMPELGIVVARCEPCGPMCENAASPDDRIRVAHPIRVLMQTDFALERIAARDAVWTEMHKLKNPEPLAPPEPEPMNTIKSELAPVVYDPRPEEHLSVLDRLDEARAKVKSGDLYMATGLYTWLWERGAAADAAFRPAQLSILAQDMAALGSARPAAMERFTKLRDVRTERLPWAEYAKMHDWFVLNAACQDANSTLEYLNYYINDTDEGGMIPPTDAMAYKMMGLREDFGKAWELPKTPAARVKWIADRVNPRFPAQVTEKERAEFKEFARQYLLDEGCREYAACLVKGDDTTAAQIAKLILTARDDAAARLSLVTTALSADPPQARPGHLEWISEAEKATGVIRDDLRNRVEMRIGGKPSP